MRIKDRNFRLLIREIEYNLRSLKKSMKRNDRLELASTCDTANNDNMRPVEKCLDFNQNQSSELTFNDRFATEITEMQGFADDSIIIVTSKTVQGLLQRIDEALRKTDKYVKSVGFCINASKSEILIVGNSSKTRILKGSIHTCIGEIEIKNEINVLGLRFDNKLSFKPQYEHLMKKVRLLRKDVMDLIGLGTNKQILKDAFAKSNGVYLYCIGAQRKWFKYQYRNTQKEILDLIRTIYNIKWQKSDSWSQNDLLRLAKWAPVRIQHAKAALISLNKIAMRKETEFLHDKVDYHLRFNNGNRVLQTEDRLRLFEENPLSIEWVPQLRIEEEDKPRFGPKLKDSFPLSVKPWFDNIPNFIKVLIGTKSFNRAVIAFFKISCWHRDQNNCRRCNNRFDWNNHQNDFNRLLNEYALEVQLDREQAENQIDRSILDISTWSEFDTFEFNDQL